MSVSKMGKLAATWAPALCGVALVIAAGFHRLQLHSPGYTTSLLIPLEFLLLLVVALGILLQPILAIVLCFKKEWRALAVPAINAAVSVGSLVGALCLDAATLLYMT